jgi:hypothetical protein
VRVPGQFLGLLLASQLDGRRKVDAAKLSPQDIDFIVGRSFDRYYDDGGLLGTVGKLRHTVSSFTLMGMDDVIAPVRSSRSVDLCRARCHAVG